MALSSSEKTLYPQTPTPTVLLEHKVSDQFPQSMAKTHVNKVNVLQLMKKSKNKFETAWKMIKGRAKNK